MPQNRKTKRIYITEDYWIPGRYWRQAPLARRLAKDYKYWQLLIESEVLVNRGHSYKAIKKRLVKKNGLKQGYN